MSNITELYGAYYYNSDKFLHMSRPNDLYTYEAKLCNHGGEDIECERGDSVITMNEYGDVALWLSGFGGKLRVNGFYAKIRGYQCGDKEVSVTENVNLPYVNGCATRQIFHPERIGDPTLQQLTIPPYTSEQMHHIHATPRVVYVLKGRGYSIVGQGGHSEETELKEGMLCILDPMSPHHFRTEGEYLTVLPVHVFSSTAAEQNHPMFNGTKEV